MHRGYVRVWTDRRRVAPGAATISFARPTAQVTKSSSDAHASSVATIATGAVAGATMHSLVARVGHHRQVR